MEGSGLGERWRSVLRVLEQVIPYYDKVNRYMSWGRDQAWRQHAVARGIRPGDRILDLGSGPGNMARAALEALGSSGHVVLVDVLLPMLREAKKRLAGCNADFVAALFEFLPLQNNAFDVVMSGFAIRDARDMPAAYREILRVLKPDDGRFVAVDLGKPDNALLRWVIGRYWQLIVPLLALFLIGQRGALYRALYRTYQLIPTNGRLAGYLRTMFREVRLSTPLAGGTIIVNASGKLDGSNVQASTSVSRQRRVSRAMQPVSARRKASTESRQVSLDLS